MVKAVGFDLGHTLINYSNPLNLSSLYRPALERTCAACGIGISESEICSTVSILTKYNTRVHPREKEFGSDVIFGEIFDIWQTDIALLEKAKAVFYPFLLAGGVPYPDAAGTLSGLTSQGYLVGVLTDVAYGMDNAFSLNDIACLNEFIDVALTSVDVGFRKPNSTGFYRLAAALGVRTDEMLFVGDEEKDIQGARNAGMGAVLIDRQNSGRDFGQDFTICSLGGLPDILPSR